MSISERDCKRVFELIGSIYFYGDFVAETVNERELEEILRKNNYFFETEDELMKKIHPTLKTSDNWFGRLLKKVEKVAEKEPPHCGKCK